MKRVTIGIGAAVTLVALIGALIPWTLSGHAIRDQLAAQIRRTTGLAMDPPTRATFALLPRPRIKLENLVVHDGDGAFSLSARIVKGDLRLLSLATGRVELSSITFYEPQMSVDIDRNPMAARGAIAKASGAPSASSQAARADAVRLAVVRLVSGEIAIRSPSRDFQTQITSVDAKLDWRRLDAPASLSGTADWRGQTTSLTAWLGHPSELLRGSASPLTLRANSNLGSMALDGSLRAGADWRFEGRANAASPSLSALGEWLNDEASLPATLGGLSLSAQAQANASALSLANLRLSIGGSDFEGSAALRRTSAHPLLSATLATEALLVTPYLSELPKVTGVDGSWSREPLAQDFGALNLDLRVSATHARIGRIELSDLGMAVLLENGRLQVDLPEAKAYGGVLKARASYALEDGVPSLTASANFTDIETAALLWAVCGYDRLSGTASGQFSTHGRGASVEDVMRGLSGDASFNVSKGEFVGVDFERALRRIDKRPLSVAAEVHGGSTGFESFSGGLSIGDDKASLENVVLAGPGAQVTLSGDALLDERALDLSATARQAGPDGAASANGSHMTIKIRGFWDDPRLVLNVAGLVRRSEAAAPLFGSNISDNPNPLDPNFSR